MTSNSKSESIAKLATALAKAQSEMGNAHKGASNPFFKSKYADLNSIREAIMPSLNANGITVLQPTITIESTNYVETILLHTSGEWISGITQIIFGKANDAQAQGSGISYARRYGLQSMICIGADDDDANLAVATPNVNYEKLINDAASKDELTKVWNAMPKQVKALANIIELVKTKSATFK